MQQVRKQHPQWQTWRLPKLTLSQNIQLSRLKSSISVVDQILVWRKRALERRHNQKSK